MSMKTWMKKYYPVPAKSVRQADALDHSIRKWQGLQSSALKAHGVRVDDSTFTRITDGTQYLSIDGETCALCVTYLKRHRDCNKCPLAIARNGISCSDVLEPEEKSPYASFSDAIKTDAKPMLAWLRKAKRMLTK